MSQHRQYRHSPDQDPSSVFRRWGLLRCELLDRATFDAALNSVSGDFDPPTDPRLMADYLLRDGVAVTRLLNDAVVIASESEIAHRHNGAWPGGISGELEILLREFKAHDAREDLAYRAAAGGQGSAAVVERLRRDHVGIRRLLTALRDLTSDYRLPAGVCTAWRVLYLICIKIDWLLRGRMDLEEDRLFDVAFGEPPQARAAAGGA